MLSAIRKLIHKFLSPIFSAIIGVLSRTLGAPLFDWDKRILETIRSYLSNTIHIYFSIDITLKTAPVSSNPFNIFFFPFMPRTWADTSASVPRCMASSSSMARCLVRRHRLSSPSCTSWFHLCSAWPHVIRKLRCMSISHHLLSVTLWWLLTEIED